MIAGGNPFSGGRPRWANVSGSLLSGLTTTVALRDNSDVSHPPVSVKRRTASRYAMGETGSRAYRSHLHRARAEGACVAETS